MDEFLVTGKNINLQFSLKDRKERITGILSVEEGIFEEGKWIPGRWLNEDEIIASYSFSEMFKEGKSGNGLKFDRSLSIQRVKLYSY